MATRVGLLVADVALRIVGDEAAADMAVMVG